MLISVKHTLSLVFLFLLSATIQAQVREIWRTGLTNRFFFVETNYTATAAAIDDRGNTVVGGQMDGGEYSPSGAAFVAKFSSKGEKAWEYHIGTRVLGGVQALGVDKEGNVFVSVRLSFGISQS